MAADPRIPLLVAEVLDSGRELGEVCRDCPELIPAVRAALHDACALDAEIGALFPTRGAVVTPAPAELPRIPGYEIQAILGHGGMGIVYRARHLQLDRAVAIKMIRSGAYAGPPEIERFRREAVAVARLYHPNIVQVHDVGECAGQPYFTMELLEGGSLAGKLAGVPQPSREAATLLATLAAAVHAAHASGIVHRDLKPGNVLLAADGTPKIADFGLARTIGSEPGLTMTGARLGTPSYMAPEQALGRRDAIGPAVDVYALGAVLYEVVAGRPPFHADTPEETERQVIATEPLPPTRLNPNVARDLETICLKCLQKEPARRYLSAAELAADLGRFLRHEAILARRIGRIGKALRWTRRNPAVATLVLLISLLLTFGTVWLVQDRVLAAERHANSERYRQQVEQAADMIRDDRELQPAALLLEQVIGPLTPDLMEQVAVLRREMQLTKQLDAIRSLRIAVVDGRFDPHVNSLRVEAEYDRVFRDAGFAVAVEDAAAAGTRIRGMYVCKQLVAALDDWATCSAKPERVAWIFDVARQADPDPSGWRERMREPSVYRNPQKLQQLAEDVQVGAQPVAILIHLAEELHRSKVDNVPFLRRVQQAFPGDFWVNLLTGDQLTANHQPQESIRYLQAALAVRPRAAVVHDALGRALAMGKRVAEARDWFLAATRSEPTFAKAHCDLGHAYEELGQYELAQKSLQTAIHHDPSLAQSHAHLGTVLLQLGRVDAAIAALQEAVRLDPKEADYHQYLGKALEAAERPGDAKAEYEAMHRLAGDGLHALLVQNRLDEALAATTRAAALEPKSAASICELGDCLAKLGRPADAVIEFRSAVALEPGNEYPRKRLLGLLVALGRHDEALADYEKAISDRPEQPQAWDGYAELCLYLGRTDDYERVRARIIERFGSATDARACELAARVCLLRPPNNALLQRATAWIDGALAADPSARAPGPLHPFHLVKSLALYRSGRFGEAITYMGDRIHGELMPAPLFVCAMAHHRIGETERAWRMLCMAGLLFDWRPERAQGRLDWLKHLLRREAETMIAPQLPDLLAGRQQATEDEDRGILLAACSAAGRVVRAAKLYNELLPGSSGMAQVARNWGHRAACIAAIASAVTGDAVDGLDATGRARCRAWARRWLGIELSRKTTDLAALAPEHRQQLLSELRYWTYDPDLAPLREPVALQAMSDAEREECRQLWARLAALLDQADRGAPAESAPSASRPAATMPSSKGR